MKTKLELINIAPKTEYLYKVLPKKKGKGASLANIEAIHRKGNFRAIDKANIKKSRLSPITGNFILSYDVDNKKILNPIVKIYNPTNIVNAEECKYREQLFQKREGFCGVYAVSYFTGIYFREVYNTFETLIGKSKNWLGASSNSDMKKMWAHYKVKVSKGPAEAEGKKIKDLSMYSDNNKWYWLHTYKHWLLMHNGFVIDQTETKNIKDIWCKNTIVKNIWQLN